MAGKLEGPIQQLKTKGATDAKATAGFFVALGDATAAGVEALKEITSTLADAIVALGDANIKIEATDVDGIIEEIKGLATGTATGTAAIAIATAKTAIATYQSGKTTIDNAIAKALGDAKIKVDGAKITDLAKAKTAIDNGAKVTVDDTEITITVTEVDAITKATDAGANIGNIITSTAAIANQSHKLIANVATAVEDALEEVEVQQNKLTDALKGQNNDIITLFKEQMELSSKESSIIKFDEDKAKQVDNEFKEKQKKINEELGKMIEALKTDQTENDQTKKDQTKKDQIEKLGIILEAAKNFTEAREQKTKNMTEAKNLLLMQIIRDISGMMEFFNSIVNSGGAFSEKTVDGVKIQTCKPSLNPFSNKGRQETKELSLFTNYSNTLYTEIINGIFGSKLETAQEDFSKTQVVNIQKAIQELDNRIDKKERIRLLVEKQIQGLLGDTISIGADYTINENDGKLDENKMKQVVAKNVTSCKDDIADALSKTQFAQTLEGTGAKK